jgi:transcription-repair coupling factor (superfamily II helicase)
MPAVESPIERLLSHPAVGELARALGSGARVIADGACGSSTVLVASCIARLTGRPVVLVVAHLDEAESAIDELALLGTDAIRLPALEVLPGESDAAADLIAERIAAVRGVLGLRGGDAPVIVAPIHALMQRVPGPADLDRLALRVSPGERRTPESVIAWLAAGGYQRREAVEEPGEFALRGGILDVFPASGDPVRLDFFGDEIERITEIDLETMGSDRRVDGAEFIAATLDAERTERGVCFLDLVPSAAVALLAETLEVTEQGRGYFERLSDPRGVIGPPAVFRLLRERFTGFAEVNQFSVGHAADTRVELPISPLPAFSQELGEAFGELAALARAGGVLVTCETPGERSRFAELLAQYTPESAGVRTLDGYIHRGFVWDAQGRSLAVVPCHELMHRFQARRRARRIRPGRAMDAFLEIEPGDFVVHADHGIAQFTGLRVMSPDRLGKRLEAAPPGVKRRGGEEDQEEFLTLEFSGKSQLHVSALKIDQVQKYIGGFAGKPPLSKLGGARWSRQKQQVAESVRDLAAELLRVRAARESLPGIRFPDDTAWQREFEAEFPYQETDDQLAALASIKRDMTDERPMDRLICGDVGFGKTELAIRAAFKACEFGKQVAVLVPTTVLAEQHEQTIRARFAAYPFTVESLSRFKTDREINAILARVRKGQVDVVIGTHRLLSKDVRFADLGLVVIDEEQRFGVEHKEHLLRLRMAADVLTLSATPIPRTLHMSMLGIRDISSLATAPADRQAIVTEVIPFNQRRLEQALARELSREGQVFWVHNRVHDILSAADEVRRLAPGARVIVGHGQMPAGELERVMLTFIRGEADILVSTTIIESGIDIPRANTIVIDNADRFGLSELHQLRGRVGRSRHRAYCYLLLPESRPVTEVARKRLKALEQYSMLGAGFKIAMRDLEIRGAGNILGPEQSGHIAAIGYEMYCRLLEEAVRRLTNEAPPPSAGRTSVEIGLSGLVPRVYIPSDVRRLEAYRRIATAGSADDLSALEHDLAAAYGPIPPPVRRLLDLAEVRVACSALGVRAVVKREPDVIFRAENTAPIASALSNAKGTVRVLPPREGESLGEVYFRPPAAALAVPASLLAILRARLKPSG